MIYKERSQKNRSEKSNNLKTTSNVFILHVKPQSNNTYERFLKRPLKVKVYIRENLRIKSLLVFKPKILELTQKSKMLTTMFH